MLLLRFGLLFLLAGAGSCLLAQTPLSRQDTLRGSITAERAWWDLTYYHLDIAIHPSDSTISGKNTVYYKVLTPGQRRMQIDLQPPMRITKAVQAGQELPVEQDGNVWYLTLPDTSEIDTQGSVTVHYGGRPRIAVRAPWDAALSWSYDNTGQPFVATSCQGEGASTWWPCKDHPYDEPDSVLISLRVPKGLTAVANGRPRPADHHEDSTSTFHWFVGSPINHYGVNANVANYTHFSETYTGEGGTLTCDYYVLPYNLEKAKQQFQDVPRMFEAFEHWFGPYPFYEDGYKLVEAPYLGMEHQSSVTYGNGYQNGYRGYDLSGTGWGLKFDFIIIHESGHEWFANSITHQDVADMWVHEGFTAYSESLFLDYHYGKEAAADYVIGTRSTIVNDRPIIGTYGVNRSGSGDMYYKGANMLHTLRQWVGDDKRWRNTLRGLCHTYYHQTVTSKEIESYMAANLKLNLQAFFDQYLRTTQVPHFEYRYSGRKMEYRWGNTVPGFEMPIKVNINDQLYSITPKASGWSTLSADAPIKTVAVDRNYYVKSVQEGK